VTISEGKLFQIVGITWRYNIVHKSNQIEHSSCTARCSFFTELVVNIWNSLPADTNFSSLSGFIRQIYRMDFIEFRSISFQCCVL